ncbi:MAG: hypothetical protein J3K34DRAFT_519026 [Monoraphidium minutum]|nr:MAG: hypothetical protein J3K34DRAFT_519026 [Monoraphidium minutum]
MEPGTQLGLLLRDSACLVAAVPSLEVTAFLAEYLAAARAGQHVVGRHFAFVAGTLENRCAFLGAARRALAALGAPAAAAAPDAPGAAAAEGAAPPAPPRLTPGDFHSLLQMLCPDFPPGPVRKAWGAACALQAGRRRAGGGSEGGGGGGRGEGAAGAAAFLSALEATWLFEHYFVAIRSQAFDAAGACVGLEQLQAAMREAEEQLPRAGWPAPPRGAVQQAAALASRGGARANFAFGDLVRGACMGSELRGAARRQVDGYLAAAAAAAAAHAAALLVAADGGGGGGRCGSGGGASIDALTQERGITTPDGRTWR